MAEESERSLSFNEELVELNHELAQLNRELAARMQEPPFDTNRIVGAMVIHAVVLFAAIALIGYWATH